MMLSRNTTDGVILLRFLVGFFKFFFGGGCVFFLPISNSSIANLEANFYLQTDHNKELKMIKQLRCSKCSHAVVSPSFSTITIGSSHSL